MFYIYAIFNNINKKYYIGKTNNINKRFKEHLGTSSRPRSNSYSYIHKAINKHGKENFEMFTLDSFDTEEECYLFESKYITLLKSNDPDIGYNMNSGGLGGINPNPEVRKKISDKRKGFKFSKEAIQKMIDSHKNQISTSRKLTIDQVIEIREIYNYCIFYKFTINYEVLSKHYNVSPYTIGSLFNKNSNKYKEAKPIANYILPPNSKVCSNCHIIKSFSSYYKENRKIGPERFASQCIDCNNSYKTPCNYDYQNKKKSLEIEQQIINLVNNNFNTKQISKQLNISYSVINRVVKNNNLKIKKDNSVHKYLNDCYEVFKLYSYRVLPNQISNILDVGRTTVFKILNGQYA